METPIDEKARKSCMRWLIMFKGEQLIVMGKSELIQFERMNEGRGILKITLIEVKKKQILVIKKKKDMLIKKERK